MNEHDQRAQFREAPEPEEGTRAAPKFVFAWIAILIVWGVGYYAWQIGKPMLGGDSRTPVATEPSTSEPESSNTAASEDAGASSTASAEVAGVDGKALFSAHCSSCHQATGQGIPGAFPPLTGSKWLQADPNIPIAIVHDGLQGEIEVAGNTFQGMMPPLGGQLSDAEIAAVLTYARSEWGNTASEVSPEAVAKHKERFGDRGSWSAKELTEVFGEH
ncbi:MAG: cytochrome c [Marinobacter sp.]|uniref:c-type cytochrome n=1 Tax=Marinobacter sp. AC-23 TaxID=1879031 RepID=UPI0008DD71CA|nr:cytochrome c [Marinobacter sp. AC-23]OHY81814.1 hypothetical protein BCA33_09795 [Marinobacter sp. AC-23]